MPENEPSQADMDTNSRENALIGYQMAIHLWTYQGEQWWARFNIMLVANSIIIASIGLAITSQHQPTAFTLLLPIVGLFLCAIWFILVRREVGYSDYYIMSARELEEKYLSDSVKTVSRGGLFAEGNPVTIEIGGKRKELRMGRLARVLRAKTAANWVIVIMTVLYFAALLQEML
jgi:hypothetical protein